MTPRLAIATQWTDPHTTKISRPLPIYYSFKQCSQGNTNNHFAWSLAQRKISATHEDPAEQIPFLLYAFLIFNHYLLRSLTLLHIQQNQKISSPALPLLWPSFLAFFFTLFSFNPSQPPSFPLSLRFPSFLHKLPMHRCHSHLPKIINPTAFIKPVFGGLDS